MIIKKLFSNTNSVGLVLCAALLGTLTGCVGYVDGPRGGAYVAVEDDYVYYPDYEIYYSNSRHRYFWPEGGAWVARPAPRGVSVDVLFASPSVRMNFHDSPANHHAVIARQYPRNWRPSGQNQNRKDDHHDDGGSNHGR